MPAEGDELRIALGMRGGVSLAVWIGGACREIDALRCARRSIPQCEATADDPGCEFWSNVLTLSGLSSVIVDVMAGASAGGLNGVIYAAAQVYGFPLQRLRRAWLKLGDLGRMIRPGEETAQGGAGAEESGCPSLLLGDNYFFVKTKETLDDLVRAGAPGEQTPRVDLTLTATLVHGVTRPTGHADVNPGEERRFASTFRFRNRGPGWLTDFPPRTDLAVEELTARLALAARGTSSYPVAFEAATVHSRRARSFSSECAAGGEGLTVDMGRTFGDASDEPFVVMDGGVLDNIPLGRAISAIGNAPADRPTRRVLVYVHPGGTPPSGTDEAAPATSRDPRSAWEVVQGVVRARVRPENAVGDLGLLEEQNRRVDRTRRIRFLTLEPVKNGGALTDRAEAARAAYLVQRADADAQEIRALLEDPLAVLGDDPFPAAGGISDGQWRAPLTVWAPEEAMRLDGLLAEELRGRIQASPVGVGIGPVRRLSLLLLEWARWVERCAADESGRTAAGEIKRELYRVVTLHAELIERPRRLGWVVLAVTRGQGRAQWEAESLEALERLLPVGADDDDVVQEYLAAGDEARLAPLRHAILGCLDMLLASPGTPSTTANATSPNLRAIVVDALVKAARRLAGTAVLPDAIPGRSDNRDPAAWIHRALARPGSRSSPPPVGTEHLEALELLTFPESVVGAPGRREIEFVELSSVSPTPIRAAFPRLLGERSKGDDAWRTIAARLTPPSGPTRENTIPSDRKLAGNELNNFSAFLRWHWRANDWMWGRLDAVAPLIELLVTPDSMKIAAEHILAGGGASTRDEAVAALTEQLRAAVVGSGRDDLATSPETSWPRFLEETAWTPRAPEIARLAASAVDVALADEGNGASRRVALGDIAPLRDAIVSARQWQVLSEELALQAQEATEEAAKRRRGVLGGRRRPAPSSEAAGEPEPPPLPPRQTVQRADDYWTGLETLTSPGDPNDSTLVRRLAAAARGVAEDSLEGRVPAPVLGAVQSVAGLLSWSWLGDRKGYRLARAVLTLAALAALVLAASASIADGWPRKAWAIGAAPGVLLVAAGFGAIVAKRCVAAVLLLLLGAGLTLMGIFVGRALLGSLAVVLVLTLLAAAALWALGLLRPRPGRS